MQVPDLDFLGDKKTPVLIGSAVLVGGLAIMQTLKKSDDAPKTGQATLIPAEGVSWDQIISRRNSGTIGVVGPGEPVRGDDAYEIAVKNGFTGTREQWLASLKGSAGKDAELSDADKKALEWAKFDMENTLVQNLKDALKPKPTTPAPQQPAPTPTKRPREITPNDSWPYYCPAPYYMGTESTGSGHHVCIHPDSGREISVSYKNRGGDVPHGTRSFAPVPAPITSRRSITVQKGDTLRSIATRAYGEGYYVPLLMFRNPGIRHLRVGDTLNV